MRTVKRLLALSIVFILGFSVAAFGKITYKISLLSFEHSDKH